MDIGLMSALWDENQKVWWKAIAALGEYLFYAATQMDDDQVDMSWEIGDPHVNSIKESLRNGEDDIVRFYACKTIENITAQSIAAGEKFA